MEAMRGFKSSSAWVSLPSGRRELRRLKRTSFGVCRRDEVIWKMFSGAKVGSVEMRAKTQETKRILRAVKTYVGGGRTGTGVKDALAR